MRTWLWLEDQYATVSDIESALSKASISVRHFRTPSELVDQLIAWKNTDPSLLESVGLILDVLLMGQRFITCPRQWCGEEETRHWQTANGYDAGLLFCEKLVMNMGGKSGKPHWMKPPPIIFLTIINTMAADLEQRYYAIRERWAQAHDVETTAAKVKWIGKWQSDPGQELVEALRKWEQGPE